jgi:deazaflavin-dependent oxidoreductase (nitroreductase family)
MYVRSELKYRIVQPLEKFVVNPPIRLAWRFGLGPPGDALLETSGRRTGRRRRTPICDGQEGDTFWLVVQHGHNADYVQNIEANPRVRVRTPRGGWRDGTARVLEDDDSNERLRILAEGDLWRRLCVGATQAMSTKLLTIRIDLDPLPGSDRGSRTQARVLPRGEARVPASVRSRRADK